MHLDCAAPAPFAARAAEHESRRLILDTAARLFREEGYAATSLRDIAGECGMKAGSLYYHFASKDEIVSEVLRTGVERTFSHVRRAVMALPPDASAESLLGTAVLAHLQAMLELHDYTSANLRIFGQVPAAIRDAHVGLRDTYEAYWAALLQRCAKAGGFRPECNLRLVRFFLIGAMNASLDWFHADQAPIDTVAQELTATFLEGLKTPSARTAKRRQKAP
jgi:AcrR family transcriptional regulator